jgi:hypothetical protein
VTDTRSDAIIVSNSVVKSVRLPQLTEAEAIEWMNQELTAYHNPEERGKKNQTVSGVLAVAVVELRGSNFTGNLQ